MSSVDEQLAAYEASRARIDELVRPLGDDRLATVVPCCPKWSVKDLVGHVTGVLEDRVASRMPTAGFEGWTDAQVARHADEPVDVVLDAWHALPVAPTEDPPSLAALSFDAVSHEHDLFQALGERGDHGTDSVRVGAKRAQERMGSLLVGAGAPGVRLRLGDDAVVIEGASAPIALATSPYAFMRLVTGRVSRTQAEAMDWDGDPAAVLDALFADGFFTLQPADVLEAELA